MVVKSKRGLGRGIDALFEDNKETNINTQNNKNFLTFVPIEFIKPNPLQPRKAFTNEALTQLSISI